MSAFIASNGMTVERDHNSDVLIDRSSEAMSLFMADGTALALREFFQFERDSELGRWRWPENPNYVVYAAPRHGTQAVDFDLFIVNEVVGASAEFSRVDDDGRAVGNDFDAAARAYFDAHPEPKPWHDARFGEVWALTDEAGVTMPATFQAPGVWMSHGSMTSRVRDVMNITAGRRVWPEVD